MTSVETRFKAAVNVIKSLPKDGPYQPTTAMMLRFYGYYKQATEGPCHLKKPPFWDIVGRTKWEAWNSNRHLSKEQAMQKYVEDLREIIETMSYTENVQNFVGSMSSLDNINLEELEMIAPGMREMAESHPSSPFNSHTNTPEHGVNGNENVDAEYLSDQINGDVSSTEDHSVNGPLAPIQEEQPAAEEQRLSNVASKAQVATNTSSTSAYGLQNGTMDQSDDEYADPYDIQNELNDNILHNTELVKQVQATVLRMNSDLSRLDQRLSSLEKAVQEMRHSMLKEKSHPNVVVDQRLMRPSYPKWWPFRDISPGWFALLVLWPFAVRHIGNLLSQRRRK